MKFKLQQVLHLRIWWAQNHLSVLLMSNSPNLTKAEPCFLTTPNFFENLVGSNGLEPSMCFAYVKFSEFDESRALLLTTQNFFENLVGSNGLEPSTSRLSGVRSNHLSYEPISPTCGKVLVEMNGIEPMTPCLQSRCSPS